MPGPRLSARHDGDLDARALEVIDAYLADLASRMPGGAPLAADIAAEMRSDLVEATEALVPVASDPFAAARAATAEFGSVDALAAALQPELEVRRARRIGLALLITGPLIGACWLASVFLFAAPPATAWRWLPVAVVPALLIGAPATAITVVSSGRLARWLRPSATLPGSAVTVAGVAAGVGDFVLLAGTAALLLTPVPAPSPLVAIAAAASLARLIFVTSATRRALERRKPFASPSA